MRLASRQIPFPSIKLVMHKQENHPITVQTRSRRFRRLFPTFACSCSLIRVRHTTSFVYIFLKTIISQRAAILRGGIRPKIASCLRGHGGRMWWRWLLFSADRRPVKDADRAPTSDRFYGSGRCHHCQCLLQPDNSSPTTKTKPSQFDCCVGFGWILLQSQTDVFVLEVIMYAYNNKKLINSIRRRLTSFDIFSNKSVNIFALLNIRTCQQSNQASRFLLARFAFLFGLSKKRLIWKSKIWGIAEIFREEEFRYINR